MRVSFGIFACVGCGLSAMQVVAQAPVLSSIEAPYAPVQTQVQMAGHTYGQGAVPYGPAGTPLVLTGSNLGTTGTVDFTGYAKVNGVEASYTPVPATVTLWTSTMLILTVPSGATPGLVTVTTSGGTSNPLPFIVMNVPSGYAATCPAMPSDSQFQIVTASLQDGTVGQTYSVSLEATGGTPPYTWSSIGNALPSGLSLSSTGQISGTPASSTGPVNLTIQAVDSNRLTTQALLPLTVDPQFVTAGTVYNYCVPGPSNSTCTTTTSGFDGVGNIQQYQDSVMGNWSLAYDTLNRLALSSASEGDFDGQNGCWSYDNFGNRTQQVFSSEAFQSGSGESGACQPAAAGTVTAVLANYNGNNHITGTNARGVTATPQYDSAGNMMSDGVNSYQYDAEGRVCAVEVNYGSGGPAYWGYIYDAEGERVAKGTISGLNCNPATNNFQVTEQYVLGQSGEQLSMKNSAGWHSNAYGPQGLLATYDYLGLHFHLTDPLGTRRVQTSSGGVPELNCENLPFGDQQNCFPVPNAPSTADDATQLHLTGKERDTESGNDYFGARYYSSAMGRFISPDPSQLLYADFSNPQSLNLYNYAMNNPLTFSDPTGQYCFYGGRGDTIENDSDRSDYDFASDGPDECHASQGQWIDDPSTTMTVNVDSGDTSTISTFPDDSSDNVQISHQNCWATLHTYSRSQQGVMRAASQYDQLAPAAAKHKIPAQILAAIAVRETNAQNITGDHGHGHGEFQFDDRFHPELMPIAYNIPKAADAAAAMIQQSWDSYSWTTMAPDDITLMAAIKDYNGGGGTWDQLINPGEATNLDARTTGHDYSEAVVAIATNCF